MNSMSAKGLAVRLIAICSFMLLSSCHQETEQNRVRKVITAIQKAAEEKDIKKIINSLSKTYSDPQGFTYDTIKGFLLGYFFRHPKIHVYITNLDVTADHGTGSAVFQAILSGGSKTGSAADVLPEALGMYAFEVSFKNEESEWKIISARWNRVGENVP